jgi:alkylated DNA repair dioxygenase AlkB
MSSEDEQSLVEVSKLCPGLLYMKDYLTEKEEKKLFKQLDRGEIPWENDLSRRTSQFGTSYNYKSKKVNILPDRPVTGIIKTLAGNISESFGGDFNNIICNEYTKKQGITAHTDSKIFGEIVCGVSIGSGANMVFEHKTKGKLNLWLEPRSMFLMEGEARYDWKHSISPLVNMPYEDGKVKREDDFRRVSITFRTLS